jgi:thiol:disulfide interchange protein DsbC
MILSPTLPRLLRGIVAGLALTAGLAATAHSQEAVIRKVLPARFPNLGAISAVNSTPVPGIYEVVLDSEIVYTDAGGEYLLNGPLIVTRDHHNVTQDHLDTLNAVAWHQLPLASAIVTKNGTGVRKMVVFADPYCGYCRKLQKETIPKLKDVTVYTFLIPIISPDSPAKAKAIVCAKEPAVAWNAWMTESVQPVPAPAACDSKVIDQAMHFARAKRIQATPTIFFPNGKLVASAMPPDELEPVLTSSQ